jgi:hypothetical protein
MIHIGASGLRPWRRRSLALRRRPFRLSAPRFMAARSVALVDVTGGAYAENRPYLVPETLRELTGPVTGIVVLPLRLDWTERAEFHLDDPAERNVMYERVIREATRIDDLRAYINGATLREAWRQLFLPARVRQVWEERFPVLRPSAA